MHNDSLIVLVLKNLPLLTCCLALIVFLIGCSEDTPEPTKDSPKPLVTKQEKADVSIQSDFEYPDVYVEELDQTQEFYKEQHETSFSFVLRKIGLVIQHPRMVS